MTLFSGAGGIILPFRKYFSVNLSWRPRKSLKRRITVKFFFLNKGMFVRVVTRYATYALIPSPTFCDSVIVMCKN